MLQNFLRPNLINAGKAGTYPSISTFQDAPLQRRLLDLPTNIRLGWKGLPETNTLAYYKKFENYGQKVLKHWPHDTIL
jgi:hypothetical protein